MSQEVVNALLFLFNHLGQPKTGIEDKIKANFDIMKDLLAKALPKGFEAKKQPGGPYKLNKDKKEVEIDPNKIQLVQDYFWIRGEDSRIKDAPVSYSLFLAKEDGHIQVRVSVEIITSYGSESRKEKSFKARTTYESMLNLGLRTPGLVYFYDGKAHTDYDKNIPFAFIKDKSEKRHVEVAKLIDMTDTDDDKLQSDISNAVKELQPYYEQATKQSSQPEIVQPAPKAEDKAPSESETKKITQQPLSQPLSFPKNIILFGPPGTGKTYHSIAYAEAIVERRQDVLDKLQSGDNIADYEKLKSDFDKDLVERDSEGKVISGHVCFTTFHQSYSYEDFIEGIFPDLNKSGSISYTLKSGVFKSLCDYAENKPEENFVLIIDEINRGNISKIFGDLISLVEEGKRIGESNELRATLPYSKEKWGVPSNVYLIGTMNTADRSIERIDTALRRRFHFIEAMPNPSLLEKYKQVRKADNTLVDLPLSELLTAMNDRITYVFDREHQIGHSYFLDIHVDSNGVYSLKDLAHVFRSEIVPLLQEYFYNNYQKIRYVLGIGDSTTSSDDNIITEKERSAYASYNFESIDEGDDEEKVYEVNNGAFDNVENYQKILDKESPVEL